MALYLTEAVEAAWGQKSFKWWIRHKFPLLRKLLSICFGQNCQNMWSSQLFTLCQNLMVDPVHINWKLVWFKRRNYILLPKLSWSTMSKKCSKAHSLCKQCLQDFQLMKKGSSSPNLSKLASWHHLSVYEYKFLVQKCLLN